MAGRSKGKREGARGDADSRGADGARLRIDKWLWCTRFYKTRALASEAVAGGKVQLNGARVKPSHGVCAGDSLKVSQGPIERVLVVAALAERRGPPSEAQQCYQETPESVARRESLKEQHALAAAISPRPQTRPDKRERRLLHRLHRRQS